jgi:FkbM family methyltransferase
MSISSGFKAKYLNLLRRFLANLVYEMEYGDIRFKRKGGLGFLKRFTKYSTPEENLLSSLDLKGKTVFDIGGYTGVLTIFFAKSVGPSGRVVVFEPNRENCTRIEEHIELNQVGNVTLLNLGIGDSKNENQTLVVRKINSATGSMEENIQSQIFKEGDYYRIQVKVDTLDQIMKDYGLPKPDFIKIDIEGMEYRALLGMSKTIRHYSPDFYIEIHGAGENRKRQNIQRIAELFSSLGYTMVHVESQQGITLSNTEDAKEGHLFCER